MSQPNRFAFFQGRIVPIEEARVSVMTHALNYGTGCFAGIRGYWSEDEKQLFVFRIDDHFKRFINSTLLLYMNIPYTKEQLIEYTLELLRRENFMQDVYIRPLAYKSSETIGVKLHDVDDDVTIFSIPFGRYVQSEEGARVTISSWRRVDDNTIPPRGKISGSYANSALIKTDALLKGFEEAIVLNQNGHVSEGSAENIFIVRDGVAYTPPVYDNILEGISRRTHIQLLRDELGVETIERPLDRTEVWLADEVFFCGTGVQVAAITEIDFKKIGSGKMGPVVTQLRELFFDVVRGKSPKYRHWCTPVY
ncbi:MAG: branched-chain amino acid transaminase [Anaerolineales bacterium]|nr:branched-chain amino acid transaminase [Anaerolineales bacterium]